MSFDPVLNLSTLDGSTGFRIDGAAAGDFSGYSVSGAGDINGDGFDDLIIGVLFADPNGNYSGSSYVVFGSTGGFGATLNLAELNGSTGFRLDGAAEDDRTGGSVSSAGDINGDGIDDLIIGADNADNNGSNSGSSYVVFGSMDGFGATLNLAELNGSTGVRLDGTAFDFSGDSVSSAGDINGDGIDDLIIGAPFADSNGSRLGSSYVVFGKASGFGATLNLSALDGSTGFRIDGVAEGGRTGDSVSSAGDINGDGIDDLIIGAYFASPNGDRSGSSYVVFGSTGEFGATLNLAELNGNTGFRIDGTAVNDYSGGSVSGAGDVNGDGINDLIIGARNADNNDNFLSGSSYVMFGSAGRFDAVLNLSTLDGSTGFRIDGAAAYDAAGSSVSSAGDINGDGIDDLIIGAPFADNNGSNSGSSYVVFGSTGGFGATLNLSALDGNIGFRIDGVAEGDHTGSSVSSAGDINGDGIDDLIIGANSADPNGNFSGSSYVVFGQNTNPDPTPNGFNIQFDYRFAPSLSEEARASIELAGSIWENLIADEFDNIPSGTAINVYNPQTERTESITLDQEIDDVLIFIGYEPIPNNVVGFATTRRTRGPLFDERFDGDDYEPWAGTYVIDTDNSIPTLTLTLHEIGHILGIGSSSAFNRFVTNGQFAGENAQRVNNNNPIPLAPGNSHVDAEFTLSDELRALMNPSGQGGLPTTMDLAILADIGYEIPILDTATEFPLAIDYEIIGNNLENPRLIGITGNDLIEGGSQDDRIQGGKGDDRLFGKGGDDQIFGGEGSDFIKGGDGNDVLFAGSRAPVGLDEIVTGDNTLLGGEGDDVLYGHNGKDILRGGRGNDYLNGYLGSDVFLIEYNTGKDKIASFYTGDDILKISSEYGFDNAADLLAQASISRLLNTSTNTTIFRYTFKLSDSDTVILDAIDQEIVASDILFTAVLPAPQVPTPQDDILVGTPGNDEIFALDGNDIVRGQSGNDRLVGQSGNDRLDGGNGNDILSGGSGRDRLFGQAGSDRLIGGSGNDLLNGGTDRDRLFGQAGRDRLIGGSGNDRLDGGSGNDVITTGAGRDLIVIRQNNGFDRVTDFQNNRDRIDLVDIRFGQLSILQQRDDVLIRVGSTNLLRLENTNAAAINQADFV